LSFASLILVRASAFISPRSSTLESLRCTTVPSFGIDYCGNGGYQRRTFMIFSHPNEGGFDNNATKGEESRMDNMDYFPDDADRAISIVSELKANAALFAAFAFGSLNLPNTLTVSESKVTSVTTSLSISRPLPESDLIQTFVILDVSTLCLMISCVAASQLLIYRLADGSYEEMSPRLKNNNLRKSQYRQNSALGRLVNNYRAEFTVARASFDLGLVVLLFAVAVRAITIFDQDIALPVTIIITTTALFLGVAYVTSYIEVFRSLEEDAEDNSNSGFLQVLIPVTIFASLVIYNTSEKASLPVLGPYGITAGESKLRVVTEKLEAEKFLKRETNNNNLLIKMKNLSIPKTEPKSTTKMVKSDKKADKISSTQKAASEKAEVEKQLAAQKMAIEKNKEENTPVE